MPTLGTGDYIGLSALAVSLVLWAVAPTPALKVIALGAASVIALFLLCVLVPALKAWPLFVKVLFLVGGAMAAAFAIATLVPDAANALSPSAAQKSNAPSVRFAGFVLGLRPDTSGRQKIVIAIHFVNDGEDAAVATYYALDRAATPPDIATLHAKIAEVRATANGTAQSDPGPYFPITHLETQHTYVEGYVLDPAELNAFRKGSVTYYLVGYIFVKINREVVRRIPFCGYSQQGELSMCPVE